MMTKPSKRTMLFFLFLFIFVLLVPVGTNAAPASSDVEMTVSAGIDECAKVGADTTFRFSLVNKGADFQGEVQVLVNIEPRMRTVYAVPVNLPSGAKKVVSLNIPVFTAEKKIDVKLVQGTKAIREDKYYFKKLIAPENPAVGILSDDTGAFRELNGLKLTESMDPRTAFEIQHKMSAAAAAGEKTALPDRPAEFVSLNSANFPDEIKVLNGFDILIISNFDTSSLSEKQLNALKEWVKGGRSLYLCAGSSWKKLYGGLPQELKLFSITDSASIPFPEALGAFTEKPSASGNINIVKGTAGSGKVVLKEGEVPLAVAYKYGGGLVGVLTFDPSVSPVSAWDGVQPFWQKLINQSKQAVSDTAPVVGMGAFGPVYPIGHMDYHHLASSVPETQTPPLGFLLIMIGIYILLAGPVLYLFLKRRDKRDLSWAIIPAMAFVFTGIIYVAGFKTRYTTAVLNCFSVINLDNANQNAKIDTIMGVFNNVRGNVKIEYDRSLNIYANNMRNFYEDPFYGSMEDNNPRTFSKLTLSDKAMYELYDVMMWSPKFLSSTKNLPYESSLVQSLSISDGVFKARLKNTSGFALREAFIAIGDKYIEVGDLLPDEEKAIDTPLDGASVKKNYQDFIDARYGPPYIAPGSTMPEGWREKNRKRNIIESVFPNVYVETAGKPRITIFALNYDDPGYTMTINDKQPKRYNTNAVYSIFDLAFKKGSRMDIPSGIIRPVLLDTKNANIDDFLNGGLRMNMDGDADLAFLIPENMTVESFKLHWSTFMPIYIKYQAVQQKGATKQTYAKNNYKFFVYNVASSKWEEMDSEFSSANPSAYIDDKRQLKVRVNAAIDRSAPEGELLSIPKLEISGVVK
ncbi:MAG: hypothetical protein N2489_01430 [Clostridia bacterium]|nr:hypothetical protein [Clostridia bacterium]